MNADATVQMNGRVGKKRTNQQWTFFRTWRGEYSIIIMIFTTAFLVDILTLVIVSGNCVSFVSNETHKVLPCNFSSKCCTRDFANIPFSPSPKLTSLLTVPEMCFPLDQPLPPLTRKAACDNATFANVTISRPSLRPIRSRWVSTIRRRWVKREFLNGTITTASAFDDLALRAARRAEFRKLRRFHFGREVPVAGICLCVAFDCALIALTCAVLNYEDMSEEDQDVEVFESFENLHGRLMREVQTQTQPEQPKTRAEKSVQTIPPNEISPEERRALKVKYPHQSDC